jgi:hypothetical protein
MHIESIETKTEEFDEREKANNPIRLCRLDTVGKTTNREYGRGRHGTYHF